MAIFKDFRDFALRGNVVDLAVGVIIGAAFGKIVDSVVNDLIMPLVGVFFKADFSNLFFPLSAKVKAALEVNPSLTLIQAKAIGPVFAWGNFLTISINFIILAFIIFWMVKMMNRVEKNTPPPPTAPTPSEKLLSGILDTLNSMQKNQTHPL